MAAQASLDVRGWLDTYVREPGFAARYPYYAYVLAALEPVLDPSVPYMGISLHPALGQGLRYYLHVNVEQVAREPRYLRGLLLHEVHHIVLGHATHPKFFNVTQPDMMQLAQETCANEYIEEPLPQPILWQHFERLGLRPGQSTLERYELLCRARAEGQSPEPKRDSAFVDPHPWQQHGPPPDGLNQTRNMVQLMREQRDQEEPEQRKKVEATRVVGRTPEQLLAQLGGAALAPERFVDWRDALRMFVARTRAPLHTWSRPSRRFPARVGQVPGRAYQHRPVLRPNLIIAIDTSLSMSERELLEVARQLRPMSELAQLFVVECDAAIARSYPFRGVIDQVKGRGGTDLRPVFERAFLNARRAHGLVYFTDGEGPYPERAPAIPVLWMLTKPGQFACPWGERARLAL